MSLLLSMILVSIAGLLLLLVLILAVEVVAAVVGAQVTDTPAPTVAAVRDFTVAVLIPAHNEGTGLQATIQDVQAQLGPTDRLLVVADNCTDDTAAAARDVGAEVVERVDPHHRGKGYALDFGIKRLSAAPPEVVIILDADCRLEPGAIGRLAQECKQRRHPIQALYSMKAPPGLEAEHRFAAFAWRVKNGLRPLGLKKLGLPCQLMGTGMAFPWSVISRADLATGHLVEDLKLGLDLACLGAAPYFCPSATVVSEFPSSKVGSETQRQRWEGGHLSMIGHVAIPLALEALRRRNRDLLTLALDLAVPPLTLLVLLCSSACVAFALAAFVGLSILPFLISCVALVTLGLAVALCWKEAGRDLLPPSTAAFLVPYFTYKTRLYWTLFVGRLPTEWTRTDRSSSDDH